MKNVSQVQEDIKNILAFAKSRASFSINDVVAATGIRKARISNLVAKMTENPDIGLYKIGRVNDAFLYSTLKPEPLPSVLGLPHPEAIPFKVNSVTRVAERHVSSTSFSCTRPATGCSPLTWI